MATGTSLHIGLNLLDPTAYSSPIPLRGCINDANDMQSIAASKGFSTELLLDQQATRANVIRRINQIAHQLQSGDIFLITFSGHGLRLPDESGDEFDGYDEAWALYDDTILDDELAIFWRRFKKGVRIVIISDSCHSATVSKGIDDNGQRPDGAISKTLSMKQTEELYKKNLDTFNSRRAEARNVANDSVPPSVLLLSGCQDNQESLDYPSNGLFTMRLKKVWNNGQYPYGYQRFLKDISKNMPSTQSPNFFFFGQDNPTFVKQSPFTI